MNGNDQKVRRAMADEEAVREVGWIARRARELAFAPKGSTDPAEHVEFYERKAALLRHIGATGASESYTPEMVEQAEVAADEWRGKIHDSHLAERSDA